MRLSGHRVAELSRASNARAFADLILVVAAIAGFVSIAHLSGHWLAYLLVVIAIGALQNRLLVLAHEAWHRKAFDPKWLNQLIGAWCYSYPVGVPFLADQTRHLAHHRLVGRPDDPDRPDYERPAFKTPAGVLLFLVAELAGAKVVLRALSIVKGPGSHAKANAAPKELLGIATCQASLILLFTLFGHWWEYIVLWLLPLVSVASFLVSYRALVEHVHPDADAGAHERLFDFAAGLWERLMVSPFLFHLHALHHAYPSVPHYRLKTLRTELRKGGYSYPARERPGYLRSYLLYRAELRAAERMPSGLPQ